MWIVTVLEVILIALVNYGFLSYVYFDWAHRRVNNGTPMPALYTPEGEKNTVQVEKPAP
jgi:hypothetical protein